MTTTSITDNPWEAITSAAQRRKQRVRVAVTFFGCGRRGENYLSGGLQPRAQMVAVCDVHRVRAERFAQRAGCQVAVQDYRQLLDRSEIDGVMVATPTTGTPSLPSTPARRANRSTSRSR